VSDKPRPERRRASRSASRKEPAKSRQVPPRRPAATRSRPAARSGGAGFLDYLIAALLVVLAVLVIAGLLFVLRVGP
jgi:uncharacterized RDD family membrane protein YckC